MHNVYQVEGIDEIFENSALHSKSVVKHAASGFFDKNSGLLNFVFADGGRGIQGAYEAAYNNEIAADVAINWAMTPGSTTRQGDIPGGLGLKILRNLQRSSRHHVCGTVFIPPVEQPIFARLSSACMMVVDDLLLCSIGTSPRIDSSDSG